MSAALSITRLTKTYASGLQALKGIDLEIPRGEIFALLGPNGAGKTTLINIVCGIVTPSSGRVIAAGHDILRDYRAARSHIGLVPQELSTDIFEVVQATVGYSRELFGLRRDAAAVERVLRGLSLWDKRRDRIMTLSGGMKRRVMIAKALAHEPQILFLDEPTAGVDVELRRDMWELVRGLRERGVTIILTTHYIEEAEEMADRVGVINHGELVLVEDKHTLMRKLGSKELTLHLLTPLSVLPETLRGWPLKLAASGTELQYTFDAGGDGDTGGGRSGSGSSDGSSNDEDGSGRGGGGDRGGDGDARHSSVSTLLQRLAELGIGFKDLSTRQSTLEEIFVGLVSQRQGAAAPADTRGARPAP